MRRQDRAAVRCSGDDRFKSHLLRSRHGVLSLPQMCGHGMARAALTPAGLCQLSPAPHLPQHRPAGARGLHQLTPPALDTPPPPVPPKPSQANDSIHVPRAIPAHPTPLGTKYQAPWDAGAQHHPARTVPARLLIPVLIFLIRAEGASQLLHIYACRIARIRQGGEGRSEPER